MAYRLLRFLSVFALAILLFACQKSDDVLLKEAPDAATFIERYIDQEILFQYAQINAVGQTTAGWVIGKDGQVRTYALGKKGWAVEDGQCSMDDMALLENAEGEVLTTVSAEEIVDYYKKIRSASKNAPEAPNAASDQTATAFYAFRYHQPASGTVYSGSCSDGEHQDEQVFQSTYYDQVLLLHAHSDGTTRHPSASAQKITNWLEGIQAEVKFE